MIKEALQFQYIIKLGQMKMMLKNILISFILLICFSFNGYGQIINEIKNSFTANQQDVLQEKLFVHTDKNKYLSGEILWFKIYNVNAENNQPLNTSKVAYVEVLDNNQIPVMQAKVALKGIGSGNGSVYIPVSISSGNYKLRAYTNWMKNFNADNYLEKNITIINPLKSPEITASKLKPIDDVQFFPEGGNLVNGLTSKVAFKVVGQDGKGVNFKGAIINQRNDTIARFRPLKFGMGNFIFKPNLKDTYKAIVYINAENKPIIKELPAIFDQGYVIQLADNANQLAVTVNSNVNHGEVYLFAHTKSVSKSVQSAALVNGTARFLIDKNLLGEGISHFTIFNNTRQPVCERLYFKRPTQKVTINLNPDQEQYGVRKKVNVAVLVKDQQGQPLVSDLSMSVYQTDSLQTTEPGDIVNYLWLTSDLKGNIESPDYYFKNKDAEADQAVDNLMLSQGWSRFKWDEILKSERPSFSFLPEYTGHLVTAKITSNGTNQPAKNVTAYLAVPGKRLQLYTSKSDSTGKLLFNTKDLFGPGEIVVQTNEEKDSTYHIDILSPFSEKYSKSVLPVFNLTEDMQNALKTHSLDMQVQNLYAGNRLKQFYNPKIDSSSFYGKFFMPYKLDDYTRFTTLEEVLREYVKSLIVVKQQKRFHIRINAEKGFLEGDPLVIIDGIPVFNIDKLMAIDPLKIRKLELVKSRYFWQATEFEGILNFATYKGDLGGYEFDPHAVIVDYEGMQLEREFYSPVYETSQQVASRLPDFRNLLYWSPSVSTNAQGKTQVTFYTSDRTGNYIGVLQGITATGEVGCQYFKFFVKQDYTVGIK